jgi:REP element-mobilizing transposase RayT
MQHKKNMSRPKRIDLSHCLFHVISRTNSRDVAFRDEYDCDKFLQYLAKYMKIFDFRVHAWCLMDTHFHLLLESRERPGLSDLMHHLLTAYTVFYNRRYNRHGHLFQGRFKSFVVDKSGYFLTVSRYIHRNPIISDNADLALEFFGSSLKYYANGSEPAYLTAKETLAWYEGDRKKYIQFVLEEDIEQAPLPKLQQRYIGNKAFATKMMYRLANAEKKGSNSQKAKRIREKTLKEKYKQKADNILEIVTRNFSVSQYRIKMEVRLQKDEIFCMRIIMGIILECIPWSQKEIADYLGLKSRKNVEYHIKIIKQDKETQKYIEDLQKKLD